MISIDLKSIENFCSDVACLLIEPKSSLNCSESGVVTTKNGSTALGIYIISSISVIAIYSIVSLAEKNNLQIALSMATYMAARIAYFSFLVFIVFFIFTKFNIFAAKQSAQLFLISTAMFSPFLVIILVVNLQISEISLMDMCLSLANPGILGSKISSGASLLIVALSLAGYAYFFFLSAGLGNRPSTIAVPFVVVLILYSALRPHVVAPLEKFVCSSVI